MNQGICAITSICEEDARWLPQYLAEMKRLNLPFVTHFDRCSDATKRTVRAAPGHLGSTERNDPNVEFDETHKTGMMDRARELNATWAMAMDVDETWDAHLDLATIRKTIAATDADYVRATWVNVWETPDQLRVDPPFICQRDKFYRISSGPWVYTHKIINGPKRTNYLRDEERFAIRVARPELVCLHWGLMTRELREQHKERWDRIYNTATNGDGNPYGIWRCSLDEERWPPVLSPNIYR